MSNAASGKRRKEHAAFYFTTRHKASALRSYTKAPPCSATLRGASLLSEEGSNYFPANQQIQTRSLKKENFSFVLIAIIKTRTFFKSQILSFHLFTKQFER